MVQQQLKWGDLEFDSEIHRTDILIRKNKTMKNIFL